MSRRPRPQLKEGESKISGVCSFTYQKHWASTGHATQPSTEINDEWLGFMPPGARSAGELRVQAGKGITM